MKAATRTDRSVLSRWWWSVDRLTVVLLLVLVAVGLLLVAAASPSVAERLHLQPFYFVKRQIVFLCVALSMMFSMSFMGRKGLWRVSTIVLAAAAFLMICAILFGAEVKGATRWVSFGSFSLQPSEFIKPAFAIVGAWLIARQQKEEKFPGQKLTLGVYLVLIGLLMLQPDLGMSVVLSCIWGVMVFLSGLPLVLIGVLIGAGATAIFGAYMFFPHVTSRIDRFLDPAAGDTYQVQKSLDSFSNGGWFGVGPGRGQVKLGLPDAHADFVFAVAGEEFGLIFAVCLIALYAFIIIRCVARVMKSDDTFTVLAVAGLLTQFGLQGMIHMGSSLQLLPAKGMTLPMISYGGSSMMSFGYALGMLLALTRRRTQGEVE